MPKPLIIGVDIRYLRIAKTGTKTYLEELIKAFKQVATDDIAFCFLDTRIPLYTGNYKIGRLFEHFRYQLWKQLILPVKAFLNHCDIVFCADDYVPLMRLGYKTIPVLHDAFCFEAPETYGKLWLWLHKKTAIPAAKRSPFVITPSHWSKKQIAHFTQISDRQLKVVYEGPKSDDIETPPINANDLLASLSITRGNYLLHAGSMFKRKNIPALIKAFGQLTGNYPNLKLVLAGPTPINNLDSDLDLIKDIIEKNAFQGKVILTGYLTNQQLGILYDNASLYVFPSTNEGFGIPILEAFKHNLPVIVADNTCLPEVGGDAVLQFNPFDTADIALKIKTVLDNDALQKEMVIKGAERLQGFSWQKAATQLIEIFRAAV